MIWAQIMPFVALSFHEGGNKKQLQTLLMGSLGLWLVLNGLFFCSIERSFVGTFFGTQTAPQYTVELFRTSTTDQAKFRVCFKNTRRYINGIEEEVKENEKRKIYGNIALLIKSPRGSAFSSSSSFVPTIQQITPFLPRPAANGIIRS